MSAELSGKVAIVTGGASGLGRATVELFVAEGARVVIADVDAGGAELARGLGAAATFRKTDVANADEVQALVDLAVERFEGLHIMVNNAGIGGTSYPRFLDDELQDFQRLMGVNLFGVMVGTQRAARHMARNGGGSIINTASIAALKAGFGVMTYRAAKAAVVQFTKSVAIDLAEYAVRVNCIAPGHIRTAMTSYVPPGTPADVAERVKQVLGPVAASSRPLKRQGTAQDVAQATLYLASERAAQVTGIVLPIDGGVTAGDAVNHLQEIMDARAKAMAS
jgi:NAD(P)-dependent dehydrogenase (short-subunit alcohol dehydrogenase family)